MPRIDPLSLLKCLSVLLGPSGGIKSKDEVARVANLMSKFSKKLVSKCIYIQILKCTDPDLLNQFMSEGGWNLTHTWLNDGIKAKNWALIQELLELILLCPVNIERLKSNDCPKLIKGLSKQEVHQNVRILASRIVEQWLKMVKGEASSSNAGQLPVHSMSPLTSTISQTFITQPFHSSLTSVTSHVDGESAVTQSSDLPDIASSINNSLVVPPQIIKTSPQKSQPSTFVGALDKQQSVSTTSSVYRIIIRDGKQVLSQVHTDASNINSFNDTNGDVNNVLPAEDDKQHKSSRSIVESESMIEQVVGQESDQVLKNDGEVKAAASKDETDGTLNQDHKHEHENDGSKLINDKENRSKKDDKKSSDKKSSLSSSKSSSKHSSSSSKHSSNSHRSSSHRPSSKSSSSSKEKSSRDKDKDRHHSSSSKSSSSKSRTERDKEKEKLKKEQAEKDKATLEKVASQSLSTKMGKIPKKKVDEPGESPSRKSSTDSKDSFKENKDSKKIAAIPEKKNISISIENRKNSQDQSSRPKTVKTFNSKFRSTGLEEEVKPPPPRGSKKPNAVSDKKVLPPKLPLKRSSPLKETTGPTDKKAKLSLDSPTTPPADEKKGGIKLIPAKPKLVFLQESDMFMDALTASTKSKEPRKRKRRTSISKDEKTDSKKAESGTNETNRDASSPPSSPMSPPAQSGANKDADDKSLLAMKPTFKFYQDTLETDEEKAGTKKEKTEDDDTKEMEVDLDDAKKEKTDDDEEVDGSRTPTPENDFDDRRSSDSAEDPAAAVSEALKKEEQATVENKPIGVLKSVLLLQKRKGPKKNLKWKTELESIRYFELDETERVNVTKTFTDMKAMEKMNEREAFQMARKLNSEDVMEEKTAWKALIPIDMPPALVEPGKDSREREIQYAREKGILQALYFHRGMIPESAAEPDEERHLVVIEPKVIPLDDLTGNKESEKDFSNVPWPEPKPQLPAPSTIMQNSFFPPFRANQQQPQQQQMMPPMGVAQAPLPSMVPPMMNPMNQVAPEMANNMQATTGGGGWRTGDGKIVSVPDPAMTPMNSMPANYQGIESGGGAAAMGPPSMMGPSHMYNQEGYMMGNEEMGFNNFQGPPGPGMFGPGGPPGGPGGPPGPHFQGGPRGPPMHGNRGRGWFRGGPPRGMPYRGGWRGNGKPVCRQFSKNGFCRVGDKCQFLHPGVNCPPSFH